MGRLKYFSWGMLAAGAALIGEIFILTVSGKETLPDIFWLEIGWLLIAFILLEEVLKFVFIKKIILEENGRAVEAFFLGAGFAFLEIVLNLLKGLPEEQTQENIFALSGIFIIHALTAATAGKMLAGFSQKISLSAQAKILSVVFLLHFLYNIGIIKLF